MKPTKTQAKRATKPQKLPTLPQDVMLLIVSFLDWQAFLSLGSSSNAWSIISLTESFWESYFLEHQENISRAKKTPQAFLNDPLPHSYKICKVWEASSTKTNYWRDLCRCALPGGFSWIPPGRPDSQQLAKTIPLNNPEGRRHKIVVKGPNGVGKTNAVIRWSQDIVIGENDPTIEDSSRQQILFLGHRLLVEIFDTVNLEEYAKTGWEEKIIREAHGFLACYSVAYKASLKCVHDDIQEIFRIREDPHSPIVLCALQCDLLGDEREISRQEGIEAAKQLGIPYVETSALTRAGIDEMAHLCLKEIFVSLAPPLPPPKETCCVQ